MPILLAYVYGVVPISLCRSGGCGVTTTNSGGVRFEFEEENDVTVGVSGPYTSQYGKRKVKMWGGQVVRALVTQPLKSSICCDPYK